MTLRYFGDCQHSNEIKAGACREGCSDMANEAFSWMLTRRAVSHVDNSVEAHCRTELIKNWCFFVLYVPIVYLYIYIYIYIYYIYISIYISIYLYILSIYILYVCMSIYLFIYIYIFIIICIYTYMYMYLHIM